MARGPLYDFRTFYDVMLLLLDDDDRECLGYVDEGDTIAHGIGF